MDGISRRLGSQTPQVWKASRLRRGSPSPARASAFRGCSKCFERLKRHLAMFRRT